MSQFSALAVADLRAPLRSTQRWQWPLAASPGLRVALGLLLFAAVWLTQLSHINLTPPIDNIEQLNWIHALEWGYYKHPPLPTWLFWVPVQLFGANAETSYVAAAALTLGSLALLWNLVCALRGRGFAAVALLAAMCIPYYSTRLHIYNHDTVLAFFSAASAVLCWKAWSTRSLAWWAALGAALGLGMLVKYQIAVTMLALLVFWLSERGWQDARQRQGLLLAGLVALLLFVPHLLWLQAHDFGPVQYAMDSSLAAHLKANSRLQDSTVWLLDQLLNRGLPAWLLLAAVVFAAHRRFGGLARLQSAAAPANGPKGARAMLLSWGLVPLMFMPLMGITTGANLQLHWGSPFLLFAVPAAMELCGKWMAWQRVPLRSALKVFAVIQLLMLLAVYADARLASAHTGSGQRWYKFDSRALADQIEPLALDALDGEPICVVAGEGAYAGALALHLADRPLVLIDGRHDRSPWIDASGPRRCGLLEISRGSVLPGGMSAGPAFPDFWWRVLPAEAGQIAPPFEAAN